MTVPIHELYKGCPFSLRTWRGNGWWWKIRDVISNEEIHRIVKGNIRQFGFYLKECPVRG
jgi:hypothetical protein